jgi:hypothetical protein
MSSSPTPSANETFAGQGLALDPQQDSLAVRLREIS